MTTAVAEIEDLTLRQLRDIRREQRELFDYVRQQGVRTDTKLIELDRSILQAREEIELTVKIEVGWTHRAERDRLPCSSLCRSKPRW